MTDTRVRSLIEAKNEAIVEAYATGDMETLADAFMEGAWQMPPNAPEGMGSFQDRGNYVVVWRRNDDGEWRILWDAPVSELPAHA